MTSLFFGAVNSAYSLAQAGIITWQGQSGTAAKDTHRYTSLFIAMDLALLTWGAMTLMRGIQEKHGVSLIDIGTSHGYVIPIQLSKAALFPTTIYLFYKVSEKAPLYFAAEDNLNRFIPQGRGNLSISWKHPTNFQIMRTLFLMRMTSSVGMLCIQKNGLFSALSLIATGHSFYTSSKMQWLKLHRTTESRIVFRDMMFRHESIENQEVSYQVLLLEKHDNNHNKRYSFCSHNHPFTLSECIERFIEKVDRIAEYATDSNHYDAVFHYENGRFSNASFTLNLDENLLPNCPIDREQPSHAFVELKRGAIKYYNQPKEPPSSLWSSLAFSYGVLQLSLKIVQHTHPHLAATIYKAQQIMMVTDITMMIIKGKESKPTKLHLIAFATVSAIAGAYLFYLQNMAPVTNLVDKLEGLIPENDLGNFSIDGTPPTMYRIVQWMEANRFLFDLTITSPNQILINGLSVAVNAASLALFSNLSWLHVKRTYPLPLVGRSIKYLDLSSNPLPQASTDIFARELSSATVHFHFITPKNVDILHLAKSIYDYSSDFFENSFWKMWWNVKTRYGVEISRTLRFSAQVINRPLLIQDLDLIKCLASWSGTAVNRFNGLGHLSLAFQN